MPHEPPASGQGALRRGGAAAGKLRQRGGGSVVGGFALRDQASSLLLLGKEAQGLVLRAITGDDQKAALAAIQRPGLGSGVDGVRSLLLFV